MLSVIILITLIVFSFYGLYTNKFYFFKFDNYIIPLLCLIHFIYLYVLWFKIDGGEYTDPKMRNLEYVLYVVFLVYLFKLFDTLHTVSSYSTYEDHLIPSTFIPMGILIAVLYLFLLLLTLVSFQHRRGMVGVYNLKSINENIDSW